MLENIINRNLEFRINKICKIEIYDILYNNHKLKKNNKQVINKTMKKSNPTTLQQYFQRMEKQRLKHESRNKKQPKIEQQNIKKTEHIKQKQNHNQQKRQAGKSDLSYQSSKNQKQNRIQLEVSGSQSQEAIDINTKKKEDLSKSDKDQKKQKSEKLNVNFYLNKIVSEPSGDYIDNIHKNWWGDYQKLESHHGFIQWLFPNSFQSRFNSLSQPLSEQQSNQFQTNIELSKRYQKSYMMMLQFYGMKLKCKQSGEIIRSRHPMFKQKQKSTSMSISISSTSRKPFYQERYYKTFLTSFHNHMRITRILSSLVMCGFGRYARELSVFLGKEINQGAMQSLKRYGVYERQWKQYSEYIDKESEMNILLKEYDKNIKH